MVIFLKLRNGKKIEATVCTICVRIRYKKHYWQIIIFFWLIKILLCFQCQLYFQMNLQQWIQYNCPSQPLLISFIAIGLTIFIHNVTNLRNHHHQCTSRNYIAKWCTNPFMKSKVPLCMTNNFFSFKLP